MFHNHFVKWFATCLAQVQNRWRILASRAGQGNANAVESGAMLAFTHVVLKHNSLQAILDRQFRVGTG